jgi:hypothetical protein
MYELGVMGTKHVPEALLIQDPSLMFEMGTGRLLVHDGKDKQWSKERRQKDKQW